MAARYRPVRTAPARSEVHHQGIASRSIGFRLAHLFCSRLSAITQHGGPSPVVIQLRAGPRCRLAPHSGAGSINRLSTMRTGREESTMEAACAPLTAATCMLLATVQSASPIGEQQAVSKKLAQQNDPQTMTASTSSDTRAEACSSSIDKAVNLCMIQSFFNIGHVYCDCTQSNVRGVPAWECVGTAMCKK
jgi:hypothetical protein